MNWRIGAAITVLCAIGAIVLGYAMAGQYGGSDITRWIDQRRPDAMLWLLMGIVTGVCASVIVDWIRR
jgi:purine-cytosine permease-like protein